MSRPEVRAGVRAALITVVLLVHALAAAPVPHVVTRDDLQNPVTREEIRRWAERLTALGYPIAPPALSERVSSVSGVIGGFHRSLLKPFRPLFRWTGTGQGWALFANPDIYPSRLEIRVRRGTADLVPIYLRLDSEHDQARDLLSYRRVRGVYDAGGNGKRPRAPYRRFAEWIGRRVLDADPSVTEVEVRMLRTHTTLRGEPPDDTVEPRHAIVIPRTP